MSVCVCVFVCLCVRARSCVRGRVRMRRECVRACVCVSVCVCEWCVCVCVCACARVAIRDAAILATGLGGEPARSDSHVRRWLGRLTPRMPILIETALLGVRLIEMQPPHVRAKLLEMWEQSTGDPESGERFLSDPDMNHFGMAPRDIPSYPIESEPGDAVFFSHQMWHSSFGGKVGRRMFTLNFRSAQTDDDEGE